MQRTEERIQDRKESYKPGIDRRRETDKRHERSVSIRKNKREERLNARRVSNLPESIANLFSSTSGGSAESKQLTVTSGRGGLVLDVGKYKLAQQRFCESVAEKNVEKTMKSLTEVTTTLCEKDREYVFHVVQTTNNETLNALMSILVGGNEEMRFMAIWALQNLCSSPESSKATDFIVREGAGSVLVQIAQKDTQLKTRMCAIVALANVSADGVGKLVYLVRCGVIEAIVSNAEQYFQSIQGAPYNEEYLLDFVYSARQFATFIDSPGLEEKCCKLWSIFMTCLLIPSPEVQYQCVSGILKLLYFNGCVLALLCSNAHLSLIMQMFHDTTVPIFVRKECLEIISVLLESTPEDFPDENLCVEKILIDLGVINMLALAFESRKSVIRDQALYAIGNLISTRKEAFDIFFSNKDFVQRILVRGSTDVNGVKEGVLVFVDNCLYHVDPLKNQVSSNDTGTWKDFLFHLLREEVMTLISDCLNVNTSNSIRARAIEVIEEALAIGLVSGTVEIKERFEEHGIKDDLEAHLAHEHIPGIERAIQHILDTYYPESDDFESDDGMIYGWANTTEGGNWSFPAPTRSVNAFNF